ncbi:unnamed protein product [Haemonchus placei]|uniref:Uncharacterized protein n=1 Tax=Haemonchus placei TaxID=6290 RepID=A0A0N4VW24_HAEPC|nr:unnamed protein product [Haemonchus placei]
MALRRLPMPSAELVDLRSIERCSMGMSFPLWTSGNSECSANEGRGEDVEAWLSKEKLSPEEGVAVLEERYKKYKYVEASMTSQKARYGAVCCLFPFYVRVCMSCSTESRRKSENLVEALVKRKSLSAPKVS